MPTPSSPAGRIGVGVIDTGIEFRSAPLRHAVRKVHWVSLSGHVGPGGQSGGAWVSCDWHHHRHGTVMCELVLDACAEVDLHVYRLPDAVPSPDPDRPPADLHVTLVAALRHILAVPEIAVVSVSQTLPLPPAAEQRYVAHFNELLRQLADQGKLVIMATGNGDRATRQTPLPGRARPGFTVAGADNRGGWCQLDNALCRWINPTQYVPDGYGDGHHRPAGGGECCGSSIATPRIAGFAAAGVRQTLAGTNRPLVRAEVENLYRVLAASGEAVETASATPPNPDRRCIVHDPFTPQQNPHTPAGSPRIPSPAPP